MTKRFGSLTAVNAPPYNRDVKAHPASGGHHLLAVTITAVIMRRSRVQAAPGQEQARGLDAALGLR